MHRRWRILLTVVSAGFGLVALVAAAGLILLQSSKGRAFVAHAIEGAVEGPGVRLELDGLDLGRTVRLRQGRMFDAHGAWLQVEDVSIRIDLGALLCGMIVLPEVSAARIVVTRLPQAADEATTARARSGDMLPVRVLVDDLSCPRIELGTDVVGQSAQLGVHGRARWTLPTAQARLDIVRLDRPDDHIALVGEYGPERAHLEVTLHEAAAGLLHSVLDDQTAMPIDMRMTGTGTLSDWRISAAGQVAEWGQVDLTATVDALQARQVNWAGHVELGPGALGRVGMPIASRIEFDGGAGWDDTSIAVRTARLRHAAAQFEITGTRALADGTLDMSVNGSLGDLSWLALPGIQTGAGTLSARVTGQPENLSIHSTADMRDWIVQSVALRSAQMQAQTTVQAGRRWQVQTVLDAHVSDRATWPTVQCTASLNGDASGLRVESVRLQSGPLLVTGAANATFGEVGHILKGASVLTVAETSLQELGLGQSRAPLSGRLDVAFDGTFDPGREELSASAYVQAADMRGMPSEVVQLLGATPRLEARVTSVGGHVRVPEARLIAPMHVTAQAELHGESGQISAQTEIDLPSVELAGVVVPRGMRVQASVEGMHTTLSAQARITAPATRVGDIVFGQLVVDASAHGLPNQASGKARAEVVINGQRAVADAAGQWTGAQARGEAQIRLAGTTAMGNGTYSVDSGLFLGRLRAESTDLAPLVRMVGAQGQGRLTAQAEAKSVRGEQAVAFQLDGTGLSSTDIGAGLHIETLRTTGLIYPGRGIARSMLELRADGVTLGGHSRGRVLFGMHGVDENRVRVTGALAHSGTQSDMQLEAVIEQSSEINAQLNQLHGRLLGQTIHLERPVAVRIGPEIFWDEAVVRYGSAELRTQGQLGPKTVNAAASLKGLRMDTLRTLIPSAPHGTVGVQASLDGPAAEPRLAVEAACPDLRFESSDMDIPALSTTLRATVQRGNARVEAVLGAAGQDMQVTGTLSTPVLFSCAPWNVSLPHGGGLSGQVDSRMQLSLLAPVLQLDDQRFSGASHGQFRISGNLSAPSINGKMDITNATYENFRTGTWLRDVHGTLRTQGRSASFSMQGTDGETGRLDVSGDVDFASLRYGVDVQTNSARVVRQDYLQSTVSTVLWLRGTESAASLRGEIIVEKTDFRIPPVLPPDVATIQIDEVNGPPAPATASAATEGMPLDLDIAVKIPSQFTVRGRGLDSEWSGALRISGEHTAPRITGDVTLLRGQFDFLDRLFTLSKGELSLDGSIPPNPYLDIVGETEIPDGAAGVHITGPAKNFRLTLSSTPTLPTDEILAMILFGRSSRQISPLQALQLAQAAAEMSGVGAAPDVLGAIKSTLGLQEVSMDSEDKDTSIGVGGYVGGKYYLRTQRSVSGQDKTKVEVQLTPQISVETEVGGDSRQGGGVSWKHDY